MDGGEWLTSRPSHFNPGKESRWTLNGKLAGPWSRSGRLGEEKLLLPHQDSNSRPSSPYCCRYFDDVTAALQWHRRAVRCNRRRFIRHVKNINWTDKHRVKTPCGFIMAIFTQVCVGCQFWWFISVKKNHFRNVDKNSFEFFLGWYSSQLAVSCSPMCFHMRDHITHDRSS
jgi:hypothetical protein